MLRVLLTLSSSPMMRDNVALIQKLETNLCSLCRSPTTNLDEYKTFVYQPKLVRLDYTADPLVYSALLQSLDCVVDEYNIKEDPQFKRLERDQTIHGLDKFEKMQNKKETSLLRQLRRLKNHTHFMLENLGSWAADHYLQACVGKIQQGVLRRDDWLFNVADEDKMYLLQTLQPILQLASEIKQTTFPTADELSNKTTVLMEHLRQELRPNSVCIIFVKRRSTAWALTELLGHSPSLQQFKFFPFVGSTNILSCDLADLADRQLQTQEFADFRNGKRDICVATEVMEEASCISKNTSDC
jgi:ERCC4-related helicase